MLPNVEGKVVYDGFRIVHVTNKDLRENIEYMASCRDGTVFIREYLLEKNPSNPPVYRAKMGSMEDTSCKYPVFTCIVHLCRRIKVGSLSQN